MSRSTLLKKTPLWALFVSCLALYACAEMELPKPAAGRGGGGGEAGSSGSAAGSEASGGSAMGGTTASGGTQEGSGGTTEEGSGGSTKTGSGGSTGSGGAVDAGKAEGGAKGGTTESGGGGGKPSDAGKPSDGGGQGGSEVVDAGLPEGACAPDVTFTFPLEANTLSYNLPKTAICIAICGIVSQCGCAASARTATINGTKTTSCDSLPSRIGQCRYFSFTASSDAYYWGELHCS